MLEASAAACIVTLAATPIVIVGMRRMAAIDEVTARSSHQVPTPRGGGIAVVLGLFAGIGLAVCIPGYGDARDLLSLTIGIAPFGLIGLVEDLSGITPLRRLALHVTAAVVVAVTTVLGAVLDDPVPSGTTVLLVTIIAPIWITAFVNVFNFMDGINGISVTTAVLAGAAFTVLGAVHHVDAITIGGALTAAAALGFGPFNFPRAHIFLGDVGSYSLGAAIAVLAVQAVLAGIPVETAVAPTALYLADTAWTLLRRVRAKEQWYLPHRTHAYQRLTTAGWSHTRVTGLVGVLTAVLAALGFAADGPLPVRLLADTAAGLVLLGYLNAPQRVAARRDCVAAAPSSGAAIPSQRRLANPDRTDRTDGTRPLGDAGRSH
ncbi:MULTISPECIES: MraY family glycosyltransferase [unclassified Frankia]